MERLQHQIQFIMEIDKLKRVLRQALLTDKSRQENSAEHSWHLAMMALVLAEHANEEVDLLRVLKILLVHDIVEIDAGDTFAYDTQGYQDKDEREQKAADRIFGLLPAEQAAEVMALWREYEALETPEARFAGALDRLQPMLQNYHTGGIPWLKHGITSDKILGRNQQIAKGSETLSEYVKAMIADAVQKGYLSR